MLRNTYVGMYPSKYASKRKQKTEVAVSLLCCIKPPVGDNTTNTFPEKYLHSLHKHHYRRIRK